MFFLGTDKTRNFFSFFKKKKKILFFKSTCSCLSMNWNCSLLKRSKLPVATINLNHCERSIEKSLNSSHYSTTKFFQRCYIDLNSVNFHWISDSH